MVEIRDRFTTTAQHTIMDMLEALPEGGRVTRGELVRKLRKPDRECRATIEQMRAAGVRIGSGMGAPGYFLCKTDAEYAAFEREYLSRAYAALANAYSMKHNNEGQYEFGEIYQTL